MKLLANYKYKIFLRFFLQYLTEMSYNSAIEYILLTYLILPRVDLRSCLYYHTFPNKRTSIFVIIFKT